MDEVGKHPTKGVNSRQGDALSRVFVRRSLWVVALQNLQQCNNFVCVFRTAEYILLVRFHRIDREFNLGLARFVLVFLLFLLLNVPSRAPTVAVGAGFHLSGRHCAVVTQQAIA